MKGKKRNVFRFLLGMVAVCLSGVLSVVSVKAGSIYDEANKDIIGWSLDSGKYAWTVKEPISNAPKYYELNGATPSYWYPEGTKVDVNGVIGLSDLKEGQHYYTVDVYGEVPVAYWKVAHSGGKCIHNDCTDMYWNGVPNIGPLDKNGNPTGKPCYSVYYSGWYSYCAKCEGILTDALVYMSKEAAGRISSVDTKKGYFYSCPTCAHIENTMGAKPHKCKDVSYNQYRVVYHKNGDGTGTVGGVMDDSYHMYNNEKVYEGQNITPSGTLSKNVYTRTGYVFKGWNTKSDGTGKSFEDCEKILNLSKYDWNEDPKRGTVTLYAQWEKAESTLRIELMGGTYNDPKLESEGGTYDRTQGIVTVKKQYGETYHANPAYVIPPLGYTVTFDTNGGDSISPMTQQQSFAGWTQVSTSTSPFVGRMKDNVYAFVGANGVIDTIEANYKNQSIILPEAKKKGYSFGGWYRDEKCTTLVGFAGDQYTASKDTTLYAKWVELALTSKENYTDNDGKGAVDLSWSQPDGKDKTYKVYMAKENGDFSLISAAGDVLEGKNVNKTYTYKEEYDEEYKKETYTIPYSGFYELSASGAQGGGYGNRSGGKGGKVTAKFYLNAGEKLTIALGGKGGTADDSGDATGGKGGYNGGKGTQYGSGGGATTITSNLQGTLLVAGGGGGASPAGNGGKGGATESNRTDGKGGGQGGQAGGGGGYVGGNKGELLTHSHEDACYKTEDLSYYFEKFKSYASYSTNDMYGGSLDSGESIISSDLINLSAHTKGDNANVIIRIGDKDNTIPVKGNTSLTIPFYCYIWGAGNGFRDVAYLRVFDQDGTRIKNFKLADYYTKSVIANVNKYNQYWIAKSVKDINRGLNTPHEFKVELPEGTTGVYAIIYLAVDHADGGEYDGAWLGAKVESLEFSGGEKKTKICGYSDGQVLSSKPAYGGSNYVNSIAINVEADEAGVRSGNGQASIQSDTIGFLTELCLNGVPAPDEKGPAGISTAGDKLTLKGEGESGVVVTFQKPKDAGTCYRFMAESYQKGSGDMLCKSNEAEETLITGVAGYYYILDTTPKKEVTADNASNKGCMLPSADKETAEMSETLKVYPEEDVMYLHIAAVDGAGNVGTTSHITLKRDSIQGGVATGQTSVTDIINGSEYHSVYTKDDKTYYVRADGETPFLLSFPSYLAGVATPDYQIDYQIFDVTMDTLHQRYSTRLPISNPVCTEEALEVIDFIREMTGDSILRDAMNASAVRKQNATENNFSQAFTLPATYHGSTMLITPVAGATNNVVGASDRGEVVYSVWSDDITHGVTLIADGEGPVINGMENLEWINRNEGTFILNISANDTLSGVKEFSVEVTNTDNSISQVYVPEEGVIKLEITEENPVFRGDFVVTAYAVDNVGNETTVSGGLTEFELTAVVERMLVPHEPLFKRGESGILYITVWGYADKVEVEFPEAFVQQNPGLNQTWWYTDSPEYKREENLQFMVPLEGLSEEEYKITVRAYKNGQVLEEYPQLYIVGTGSVTEELRTRLR